MSVDPGCPVVEPTTLSEDALCLKDRHWYVFLCSSFITFFTGLLLVLSWRILTWIVCHKSEGDEGDEGEKDEKKPENPAQPTDADVGWVTEAKDWAGELISGQTTTGRILVSIELVFGRISPQKF